jgi:hypothetical protein
MTTGNGVPTATDNGKATYVSDGSKNLRDIEDLVAKLRIVTKQLALPARSMPETRPACTNAAYASGALPSSALTTSSVDEFAHAQSLGLGEAGDPSGERSQ